MMMSRKFSQIVLALGVIALIAGCFVHYNREQKEQACSKDLFAMDTVMRFTAYGPKSEEAVDAAIREIQRLDALLSVGSASGEVSRMNGADGGEVEVSEDTACLLTAALELYRETGGLFDCTVYPLVRLWGFPTREYHVPTDEELAGVLPLVDASRIRFDGRSVSLGEGQQIDFGGIAKGYASQRVMEIFREFGVSSGMVSLGGNIQVLGGKPDGSDWRIGVQDPAGAQGDTLAVIPVRDRAVVTSGGYERFFVEDGRTYIHILNPSTGYPADTGLSSVTVVAEDGMRADGLSTALFMMGAEGACEFWRECGGEFELVLVTVDREIFVTEGISGQVQAEGKVNVVKLEGDG